MNSVSAASRSRTASAKSVPSTLETKRKIMLALAVVLQRLIGHDRTEVGAADADIDHVADAFAGMALPAAAAQPIGEIRHLVQNAMDLGNHVLAIDLDARRRAARAERHEAPRASPMTLILSPRNMASMRWRKPRVLGQPEQQLQRLVGDPVLRIVEIDSGTLGRQSLAALRILGEELPQMQPLHLLMVGLQRRPGRALAQWQKAHRLVLAEYG